MILYYIISQSKGQTHRLKNIYIYTLYILQDLECPNPVQHNVFCNRPNATGAVLQTPSLFIHKFIHSLIHSFIHLFIQSLTEWLFSSKPLKHHYTQTVKLESWHFERMFTPHMSHVRRHLSRVRCHMSGLTTTFFLCSHNKVMVIVGGGSVINRAYPV